MILASQNSLYIYIPVSVTKRVYDTPSIFLLHVDFKPMVLNCNSEIGAHARSNLCCLIKAFDKINGGSESDFFFFEKRYFLYACATNSDL